MAGAPEVSAQPDEIRRLEEMTRPEREEFVRELVLEATRRRVHQMWGERFWTPDDDHTPPDDERE